jgi:hypothetical protein
MEVALLFRTRSRKDAHKIFHAVSCVSTVDTERWRVSMSNINVLGYWGGKQGRGGFPG